MTIKIKNIEPDKYQRKAINCKKQNILVIAGAGSGKTFTIVAKIKKLIFDGILPEEILCLSFTKTASKDLEKKLEKENIKLKVKTFHSLGYEIIKKHKEINLTNGELLEKIINKNIKQEKNLRRLLNVQFIRLGYKDKIFNKIEKNILLNTKYKEKLKSTIKTFINLYKGKNMNIKDFETFELVNKKNHLFDQRKRHKIFLRLTKQIIKEYQKELRKKNQIDYHDMINFASKLVRKGTIINYKYIIIDEYQDTSINKINLIKEIQRKTDAKLMAVGDDWQSIYGFAGSDLEIFVKFKKYFKKAKIIKLRNTYRNSKELINVANKFITKNPLQIKKRLISKKTIKKPIVVWYYNRDIKEIWNNVLKNTMKNKLILGRNNKDLEEVPKSTIKYLTFHSSKGLEVDDTIIINLQNKIDSIPSKIIDSEFLKYVKPQIDKYPYAEERRLFYVALTRSRHITYLLVKKNNPSEFITEIIKDNKKNISFVNT